MATSKDEIKEAVAESLLEALAVAEEKQREHNASARGIIQVIVQILQVVLLPTLAYLLLQSVQVQKQVAVIQVQIAEMSHHLKEHDLVSSESVRKNAVLHHRNKQLKACSACHSNGDGE